MGNNSQIAFNPLGKTVVVPAAGTASTAVQAPVLPKYNPQNTGQYRFVNAGIVTVFYLASARAALNEDTTADV